MKPLTEREVHLVIEALATLKVQSQKAVRVANLEVKENDSTAMASLDEFEARKAKDAAAADRLLDLFNSAEQVFVNLRE